jgi:hypothetical protein
LRSIAARNILHRSGIRAEILCKAAVSALDARHVVVIGARIECADDYLEPSVGIVLIQAHFKVLCRRVVGKQHGAPFDVEYAVRCAPGY